jgi:hypothetical protein
VLLPAPASTSSNFLVDPVYLRERLASGSPRQGQKPVRVSLLYQLLFPST